MAKHIRINTPWGRYLIPLWVVAVHRANHYRADKGEEYNNEITYLMNDDFEGIDWIINNTNWVEWRKIAFKYDSKVLVTDIDFWTDSEDFDIIEYNHPTTIVSKEKSKILVTVDLEHLINDK